MAAMSFSRSRRLALLAASRSFAAATAARAPSSLSSSARCVSGIVTWSRRASATRESSAWSWIRRSRSGCTSGMYHRRTREIRELEKSRTRETENSRNPPSPLRRDWRADASGARRTRLRQRHIADARPDGPAASGSRRPQSCPWARRNGCSVVKESDGSVGAQGDQRIDARRAPRRQVARQKRRGRQHRDDRDVGQRIRARDASQDSPIILVTTSAAGTPTMTPARASPMPLPTIKPKDIAAGRRRAPRAPRSRGSAAGRCRRGFRIVRSPPGRKPRPQRRS